MKTSNRLCSRPAEIIALSILALICVGAESVTAQSWPQISFGQAIGGFTHPTHLASARDGSGRLFVVEQSGRIRIIKNGSTASAMKIKRSVTLARSTLSLDYRAHRIGTVQRE